MGEAPHHAVLGGLALVPVVQALLVPALFAAGHRLHVGRGLLLAKLNVPHFLDVLLLGAVVVEPRGVAVVRSELWVHLFVVLRLEENWH